MLSTLLATTTLLPQTLPPIKAHFDQTTPISPYIYGANFPNWDDNTDFTLARQGGNRMTAYNWETNASNAGADYRHQNDAHMGETDEPGWAATSFMEAAQDHNAAVILTVPTAGYVAADKGPEDDVNKTPNYLETRFHKSYANKPDGLYPATPDTTDKTVYQDEFVLFLMKKAAANTPVWFSLDNEPALWHHTHARIVPKNPTYAEIIANNIEFAQAIKSKAPKSQVFGPALYGWQAYRTFQNATDANGRDFLDVYLTAMKEAEASTNKRLLDVLDLHWYPEAQGDGARIVMGDPDANNKEARVQAPRSLWDKTYVENSWIAESIGNQPIVLLPNVKAQIRKNYPGTKLALTEYDYGGDTHPSGTVAQADVLGLFGRNGLFAASHWGVGWNRPAILAAFRAYTNFDGKNAKFGDIHVNVSGQTPDTNSAYVSLDSKNPGRVVLVAVNKKNAPQIIQFDLTGYTPKTARAFIADPEDPQTPKAASANMQGSQVSIELPAWSVATVELNK